MGLDAVTDCQAKGRDINIWNALIFRRRLWCPKGPGVEGSGSLEEQVHEVDDAWSALQAPFQ